MWILVVVVHWIDGRNGLLSVKVFTITFRDDGAEGKMAG